MILTLMTGNEAIVLLVALSILGLIFTKKTKTMITVFIFVMVAIFLMYVLLEIGFTDGLGANVWAVFIGTLIGLTLGGVTAFIIGVEYEQTSVKEYQLRQLSYLEDTTYVQVIAGENQERGRPSLHYNIQYDVKPSYTVSKILEAEEIVINEIEKDISILDIIEMRPTSYLWGFGFPYSVHIVTIPEGTINFLQVD